LPPCRGEGRTPAGILLHHEGKKKKTVIERKKVPSMPMREREGGRGGRGAFRVIVQKSCGFRCSGKNAFSSTGKREGKREGCSLAAERGEPPRLHHRGKKVEVYELPLLPLRWRKKEREGDQASARSIYQGKDGGLRTLSSEEEERKKTYTELCAGKFPLFRKNWKAFAIKEYRKYHRKDKGKKKGEKRKELQCDRGRRGHAYAYLAEGEEKSQNEQGGREQIHNWRERKKKRREKKKRKVLREKPFDLLTGKKKKNL